MADAIAPCVVCACIVCVCVCVCVCCVHLCVCVCVCVCVVCVCMCTHLTNIMDNRVETGSNALTHCKLYDNPDSTEQFSNNESILSNKTVTSIW